MILIAASSFSLRRSKSTVFISYIRTESGSFATVRENIQSLLKWPATPRSKSMLILISVTRMFLPGAQLSAENGARIYASRGDESRVLTDSF
jgi:hypothetical protein